MRDWAGLNNRIVPFLRSALHNIIFTKARRTISSLVRRYLPSLHTLPCRSFLCSTDPLLRRAGSLLVELRGPHESLPAIHLVSFFFFFSCYVYTISIMFRAIEPRRDKIKSIVY